MLSEIEQNKNMTLEEFDKIIRKDSFKYELIDGVVFMSPRPSYGHQRLSGKLFRKLADYFDNKSCEPFLETEFLKSETIKSIVFDNLTINTSDVF